MLDTNILLSKVRNPDGDARSLNLTLVSNNTREFERVPGLKLENWLAQ